MTTYANIAAQIVTDDLYTFTLDNATKTLAKIEYTGEVVDGILFTEDDGFNSYSLHETRDNNILVYSVSANMLYYINPFNLSVWKTESVSPTAGKHMTLDVYGNTIFGDWDSIAIDNDNQLYTVEQTLLSADYETVGFNVSSASFLSNDITTYSQITSMEFYDMAFSYSLSSITGLLSGETISSPSEKISINDPQYVRRPLLFTNDNYEQVQFDTLYKNSGTNGLISKPFNPKQVFISKENYLYILNDTREILELELNFDKPPRYSKEYTLFGADTYTGNNIYDVTESGLYSRYIDFKQTPLWPSVSSEAISTTNMDATFEINPNTNAFETYFWIIDSEEKALYKLSNDMTIANCFSLPEAIDTLIYTGETYSAYTFTNPPATTYTWHRKYDWIASGKQEYGFSASVYAINSRGVPERHYLPFGNNILANNQWYHIALTYDIDVGKLSLYLDNILLSEKNISPGSSIYSFYETGGMIGAKLLRSNSINEELDCDMYSFDGSVYGARIYDNALTQSQLAQIILSDVYIDPMEWNIPTAARQYIERVERFFMNRQPGHSSQFYKIRLVGLNITDTTLRSKIEQIINDTITKVAPAYTSLYAIEWE